MSHILLLSLTLLLLFAGPCATQPASQTGPWSLKLTTSGGFAGVGAGNLEVNSEGKFSLQMPVSQPNVLRKGCEGTLREPQLQAIREAVAQSNPKEWSRPDLNIAAPDAFSYKLELRLGSNAPLTTVQWYDNTRDKLPTDLKRLSDVLMQTMKPGCYAPPQ